MSTKGGSCRFIRGKYCGLQGWLNADKPKTRCYTHVIINKPDGSAFKEYHTKVRHESLRTGNVPTPTTFEEAILQQHPDIEQMIDKLAKELARCHLAHTSQPMLAIINLKLSKHINAQSSKGNTASWRDVTYESVMTG
jgi:hypothetical protein